MKDGDQDGYYSVRSLTYNNGDPYPPERMQLAGEGHRSFVAEVDGKIGAVCDVLDLSSTRGQAVLPCGGVCGVAVAPDMRRSGVGTALMSWLVRHMRETSTPVSSLYAFREPFYRKFGYEVAGMRLRVMCPTTRWPKFESRLPVWRTTPGGWRELTDCYAAFAGSRSGLVIRTEKQWQRVLGENRQLTVYVIGKPAEAYAVVSHSTAFWTTDHVSEVAWSTRAGYEGLLGMLEGLAINKAGLSWFEPSDGPFYFEYLDQGCQITVERPVMYRITDVPAALRGLSPSSDVSGEFVLRVEDRLIPENEGPWAVRFASGSVEVAKAAEDPWDVSMNVRHFVQAFQGEPGIDHLLKNGIAIASTGSALNAFRTLLPPQATYCMDFF